MYSSSFPNFEFSIVNLAPASFWILEKYLDLEKQLLENQKKYELAHSIEAIYDFLWDSYADWYVEYLKSDKTQFVFAKSLFKQFIISASPYLPFETETLWRVHFGEKNLLGMQIKIIWPWEELSKIPQNQTKNKFQKVVDFIVKIRSLKGLFALDPAKSLDIYTSDEVLLEHLNFINQIAKINLLNSSKSDLYVIRTGSSSFGVDILKEIKDKSTEKARTQKQIQSLKSQILGLESLLNSQEFMSNAEPEVIMKKQEDLAFRKEEQQDQENKLNFLLKN